MDDPWPRSALSLTLVSIDNLSFPPPGLFLFHNAAGPSGSEGDLGDGPVRLDQETFEYSEGGPKKPWKGGLQYVEVVLPEDGEGPAGD